jgi:outer membrane protein OmpA-like peptidoglycan-associated protein
LNQYRITTLGKFVLGIVIVILIALVGLIFTKLADNAKISNQDINKAETETLIESIEVTAAETEITTVNEEMPSNIDDHQPDVEVNPDKDKNVLVDLEKNQLSSEDEIKLMKAYREIYFKPDETFLTEKMMDELNDFVLIAKDYPFIKIHLDGYALKLSLVEEENLLKAKERVDVLKAYLLSNGIKEERIEVNYVLKSKTDYPDDEMYKVIRADIYFDGYDHNTK